VEIGDQSNGFVAYIYADGNNMGGYIQQQIKTPEEYHEFSNDIFEATKDAVYYALAEHLTPRQLNNLSESKEQEINNQSDDWIHPFEIIAIGGDDVLIIVPADKALEIGHTIGVKFEELLLAKNPDKYQLKNDSTSTC
jgi:CRISPR-associated protein Cmr2